GLVAVLPAEQPDWGEDALGEDPAAAVRGSRTASAEVGRQVGVFGPRVEVPQDAPAVDRWVGLFGRDPRWSPGG
ncbi:MAG: hypothetical protein JWM62_2933, partial [Frankiales bacterium]|nr:hypothetical protein [Frankiales bacterium]